MAIFKGRENLFEMLQRSQRLQDQKGIEGEIRVGDLLGRFLPPDTYIISQPEIGRLNPDFLVVSPDFGFRLIEVKNIDIRNIEGVLTNGLLKTRFGDINPLLQVKAHGDALNNYLVSNHKIKDSYKNIGYCVLHLGFSKQEFELKFAEQISMWTSDSKRDYFKFHLFTDQLDSRIQNLIKNATKFYIHEHSLSPHKQLEIVNNIKISSNQLSEDGYFHRFNEYDEKIDSVSEEIKQIKDSINYRESKKKETSSLKIVTALLLLLLVGGVLLITFDGNTQIVQNSGTEEIESVIEMQAEVISFYFNSKSETKFLVLSDGENEIEAVIFKDTKVPYIKEGNIYTFLGYMQSYDEGKEELRITSVR